MSAAAPRMPTVPAGTGTAGRRLWRAILGEYEFEEHELLQLREIVRTVDLLDELQRRVKKDGPVVESPQGSKAHPALVEMRQQRVALARLMAALRLPAGEQEGDRRPQRRTGVRGIYRAGRAS
jgi:hypothetical protein